MMKMKLYESPVVFLEQEHQYWLGFDKLQGVTTILKDVLFPHKYDVPERYKDNPEEWQRILDNSARRGTAIHEAIQDFEMGRKHEISEYADAEIQCFDLWKDHRLNFVRTLADEYLVSNEKDIASKIDLVQIDGDDNHLVLADIKTTSIYDAEYLSWQLSVYAYLFERQNLELKVSELVAYWFKQDYTTHTWAFEIKQVARKTDAEVEQLFEWWRNGEVHEVISVPDIPQEAELPAPMIDLAERYAGLDAKIAELTAERDQFRDGILQLMNEHKIDKFSVNDGQMKVCRIEAGTRVTFDSARFKQDNPQLYKDYEKVSPTKESVKITIQH